MLRAFGPQYPRVHPTAYIDDSAQVIGDVEVGEDSSIWMTVVVRGDVNRIRIGCRTNIQDGSVVHVMRDTHATILGDDVTVGHAAVLHGCTIEDRCLIGMGAILLNGAHVGTGSIVAAGSLLVEGVRIPPRSLVMGSPGKVRREVTDEEFASILDYAERYVGYKRHYSPMLAAAETGRALKPRRAAPAPRGSGRGGGAPRQPK
jgi:carbonic anhydrase/acetyltransferase-like protein (isoleucine patch superfamily)